jgi:hypothetical protein
MISLLSWCGPNATSSGLLNAPALLTRPHEAIGHQPFVADLQRPTMECGSMSLVDLMM